MEAEGKAAERIGDVVVVEEDLEGKRRRSEDERSTWRKGSAVTRAPMFSPAWLRSSQGSEHRVGPCWSK